MDDPIVLRDLPQVRPATMPKNIKQEDTLLNKVDMTRGECDQLIRAIDNALEGYQQA